MALDIYLQNTLGRQKQRFVPIKQNEAKMYTCGPTVYNYLHIGNLRAYVFADILKRVLIYNGYKVTHVMNVTDVGHLTDDADYGDDKMVNGLKREGIPFTIEGMRKLADQYFSKAVADMNKLLILPADHFPFASEHIGNMVDMIQVLLRKGVAYKTEGTIYFDTTSIPDYGKLSKAKSSKEHSRIDNDISKRHPEDFALWKFSKANEPGFESSIGKGFPGWHIECSAMSEKYLGVPFDIHTGGIDHISVHHNNEIAQTEASTGKLLANYWLHNEHLTISESKMAKSGDNFITLDMISDKGITPLAYRYWLLTARYSTRMDYSIDAIGSAQIAYNRLKLFISEIDTEGEVNSEYKDRFLNSINDDLDTPKALAIIWDLIKDPNISNQDKKATILDFDKVLGLGLRDINKPSFEIPENVKKLLQERLQARSEKDWQRSDELRDRINKLGFDLKDSENGQIVTPN